MSSLSVDWTNLGDGQADPVVGLVDGAQGQRRGTAPSKL